MRGEWSDALPHTLKRHGGQLWPLTIHRDPALQAQHYRLRLGAAGGTIEAGDRAGAWNGLQTAQQWLSAHHGDHETPSLEIEDQPDFVRRGVTLDISRCRVPTLESLFQLVDTLAGWKINQLQLYTEHTFAYAGHEEVWRHSSPLTAEEIRRFSRYAAAREIRLVPNQNSLGHFHRWLKHPSYRYLAECPDGIEHPFSTESEPYGLCATEPRVFELLSDLYSQLLPNFDGDYLNAGCDEPIDLGRCRSEAAAAERGRAALFVDYVHRLRRLAARWGRELEIWADAPLADPEILESLDQDIRLQVWRYEAKDEFDAALEDLAGRDLDVCPGTSSWSSLAGRTANALANIRTAARQGVGRAAGLVVTDWGDHGHPQAPSVSTLGLMVGADVAWNSGGRTDGRYRALLEQQLGGGAGEALFDLGRSHEPLATPCVNGTPLFHLLFHWREPLTHPRYAGLTAHDLERARSRAGSVPGADPEHPLTRQIEWTRQGLLTACDLGVARLEDGDRVAELPARRRSELVERLTAWRRDYAELWRSTSRPGGFAESVSPIDSLLEALADS